MGTNVVQYVLICVAYTNKLENCLKASSLSSSYLLYILSIEHKQLTNETNKQTETNKSANINSLYMIYWKL